MYVLPLSFPNTGICLPSNQGIFEYSGIMTLVSSVIYGKLGIKTDALMEAISTREVLKRRSQDHKVTTSHTETGRKRG